MLVDFESNCKYSLVLWIGLLCEVLGRSMKFSGNRSYQFQNNSARFSGLVLEPFRNLKASTIIASMEFEFVLGE